MILTQLLESRLQLPGDVFTMLYMVWGGGWVGLTLG